MRFGNNAPFTGWSATAVVERGDRFGIHRVGSVRGSAVGRSSGGRRQVRPPRPGRLDPGRGAQPQAVPPAARRQRPGDANGGPSRVRRRGGPIRSGRGKRPDGPSGRVPRRRARGYSRRRTEPRSVGPAGLDRDDPNRFRPAVGTGDGPGAPYADFGRAGQREHSRPAVSPGRGRGLSGRVGRGLYRLDRRCRRPGLATAQDGRSRAGAAARRRPPDAEAAAGICRSDANAFVSLVGRRREW